MNGVASLVFAVATVVFLLTSPLASAQDSIDKLQVGAADLPPFTTKTTDGRWRGLSFDLLDMIVEDLGRDYEVHEFSDIKALTDALEAGEIDLVSALAAREETEERLDLSQPYYRSGLAIATSRETGGQGWMGFFRSLDLLHFLWVVGGLMLLWLIAGASIWLLERHHNKTMFGGKASEGLGHGIWWAAVTMTTVGYGDKAPVTVGGRAIAVIWMFASIVLVSSFTASISASLTADRLVGKVRGAQDLPHSRVGTIDDTSSAKWLGGRGIPFMDFRTLRSGLQAIVDNEIDAFIFDEAVLKNVTASDFSGEVYVLPGSFEHYYVGMAVRNGSPLRESVNRSMLRIMVSQDWQRLLARHAPEHP